jgi:hypothetical protein
VPRLPFLLAPALLLAALAPAGAAASPRPWATVNVCDTAAAPDSMGVRAGMQGTGRPRRVYMRFRAQYILAGRHRWHAVKGSGTSPWVFVGLVRRGSEQAGWTFAFDTPAPGHGFLGRGIVDFQWRARRSGGERKHLGWVVVKRRRAVSRKGLDDVDGGDPPGTSLASCLIG